MTKETGLVSVQILDKTYQFKCPKDKIVELHQAAMLLNNRMQSISQQNPLKSIERTVIMAAMNISHELLELQEKENLVYKNMKERIKSLQTKVKDSILISKEEEFVV